MFKRYILNILVFLATASIPTSYLAARRSFAIVIDKKSLSEARPEIDAYISAIEKKQGLKVYTITDIWGIPDSIRTHLHKLFSQKKDPIIGAVFIGDIPIPMIQAAQHLTSAFKMSETAPREESSVPSDRFYDDFELKFINRGHDENTPYFYYLLSAEGAQTVSPDIFSGRIRPTDAGGTSRYEKLRTYLRKATQAKLHPESFNSIFVFNGNGSLSESNVAHIDEFRGYNEHFPELSEKPESYSYMEYGEEPYIKEKLKNELMRPDLSMAMLHHHGDWDTQYLSAYPQPHSTKEAIDYICFNMRDRLRTFRRWGNNVDSMRQVMIKENGIPAEWLADAGTPEREKEDSLIVDKENLTLHDFASGAFRPNVRMAIFDACYNGSFHKSDCIANEYIFQPGHTLIALGGTVNVLQDKWPDHFIGLLAEGMLAGYLVQNTAYLEWHLIGDPTFCFAARKGSSNINALLTTRSERQWLALSKKSGDADLQAMAIFKARTSHKLTNSMLLHFLKKSPYAMVRIEAFNALKERGGNDFIQAIEIASHDNYELLQRFSVNEMSDSGDPRLVPSLMRLLTRNNVSARVKFNAIQSLQFFPENQIHTAADKQLDSISSYILNKDDFRAALDKNIKTYCGRWDADIEKLCQNGYDTKHALRQVNYMRIYLPPYLIPQVVDYTAICKDPQLQRDLLEALGWHRSAYTADKIRELAKKLSEDARRPEEVRQEALKTLKRVSY